MCTSGVRTSCVLYWLIGCAGLKHHTGQKGLQGQNELHSTAALKRNMSGTYLQEVGMFQGLAGSQSCLRVVVEQPRQNIDSSTTRL
jgi:hypothetical protein